jgi:D-alanyl-D-alanine carboxypeptidase/D-alanyl-D-alanine-endopeptidase (penicillin-binding protein 4)
LLREIGRAKKQDPSLQPSLEALQEFWEGKKINLDGFYPADGSGLSRSNNLCPRTLVEILSYMYKSPAREFFFNSLPLAGVSGTLDHSFKKTPLENNLRAKTGSIKRVRSMAGILTNRKGNKIIFALIINNYEGKGINQVFEDFLMDLYRNSLW